MSKIIGPYFEFVLKKEGAKIDFVFLPGNIAKKVYIETCQNLYNAIERAYTVSTGDYVRKIVTEDGLPALSIKHTKVEAVISSILEHPAYKGFKIKVTGLDKTGSEKTVVINTPIEAQNALEVMPYFNKNNNDMTSRRRK